MHKASEGKRRNKMIITPIEVVVQVKLNRVAENITVAHVNDVRSSLLRMYPRANEGDVMDAVKKAVELRLVERFGRNMLRTPRQDERVWLEVVKKEDVYYLGNERLHDVLERCNFFDVKTETGILEACFVFIVFIREKTERTFGPAGSHIKEREYAYAKAESGGIEISFRKGFSLCACPEVHEFVESEKKQCRDAIRPAEETIRKQRGRLKSLESGMIRPWSR